MINLLPESSIPRTTFIKWLCVSEVNLQSCEYSELYSVYFYYVLSKGKSSFENFLASVSYVRFQSLEKLIGNEAWISFCLSKIPLERWQVGSPAEAVEPFLYGPASSEFISSCNEINERVLYASMQKKLLICFLVKNWNLILMLLFGTVALFYAVSIGHRALLSFFE